MGGGAIFGVLIAPVEVGMGGMLIKVGVGGIACPETAATSNK